MAEPFCQLFQISFLQADNCHSPISLALPTPAMPPALQAGVEFSLRLELILAPWMSKPSERRLETLMLCQIYAFIKPLNLALGTPDQKASLCLPIGADEKTYSAELSPFYLDVGIYSLQIIMLINYLPSSPLFREVPLFQVN